MFTCSGRPPTMASWIMVDNTKYYLTAVNCASFILLITLHRCTASFVSSSRGHSGMTMTTTTLFARRQQSNFSRVKNQWKRNSAGLLDYERWILEKDDSVAFVLGSDEAGRGAIAGPVIAATCCILPLRNYNRIERHEEECINLPLERQLESLLVLDVKQDDTARTSNLIRDSKQLSSSERECIFDVIVRNPEIFAFTVSQRSNTEIDERQNILLSTMDCFQESIEDFVSHKLPSDCRYSRVDKVSHGDNFKQVASETDQREPRQTAYSVVDGKKAPKLSLAPILPCRPYINGDAEIFTVSLASVIAKVSRDRLAKSWHQMYPQYGFLKHKGYATNEHIEAIHKHGPCPLHRMTFKSLKGR